VFHHAPVLVLALGIGIGIGQYYWVLGAYFGIVLTLKIGLVISYFVKNNLWIDYIHNKMAGNELYLE